MNIVKIGGGADIDLQAIIEDLVGMEGACIIVHGANHQRDMLMQSLGMEKQVIRSLSGYSSVFSDDQVIEAMMMSYSGLVNTQIVELCHQHGINAIGLTGLDGGLVRGKRNKGIRTMVNGKKKILRDRSGKPQSINTELLDLLLGAGYTPVLTMPIADENGIAINSENDDLVRLLCDYYRPERVFFMVEEKGLLRNYNDKSSVISELRFEEIAEMEQQSEGRIKRKIHAIRQISQSGTNYIHICDGRVSNSLSRAIAGEGTLIFKRN